MTAGFAVIIALNTAGALSRAATAALSDSSTKMERMMGDRMKQLRSMLESGPWHRT
jgi:hypothetical protein